MPRCTLHQDSWDGSHQNFLIIPPFQCWLARLASETAKDNIEGEGGGGGHGKDSISLVVNCYTVP